VEEVRTEFDLSTTHNVRKSRLTPVGGGLASPFTTVVQPAFRIPVPGVPCGFGQGSLFNKKKDFGRMV
jgi:hypothetical protein